MSFSPSASQLGASSDSFDRESTVASSDEQFNDSASNTCTETIDLLSDTESSLGDDEGVDRKPSPAPSFSRDDSVEVVDFIQRGPPRSAFSDDQKPALEDMKPYFDDTKPQPTRNHPTGPRLTEAQKVQIVSLREAGWTHPQIAEHIGRNVSTVNSFLARRRYKIHAMLADIPGSRPLPPPGAARGTKRAKQEGVKPTVNAAGPSKRRRVANQEPCSARGFDSETQDLLDVKPTVRAKKEEPL